MKAVEILRLIDDLTEQQRILEKRKASLYLDLKKIKEQIEHNNKHLIGKSAQITREGCKPSTAVCTSVIALNDYSGVRPLFELNGKKVSYINYEWV